MTTRITNVPTRDLPPFDPSKIDTLDGIKDYLARLHKYLAVSAEENHRQIVELDDAMPGDRRDRMKVRSRGPNVEFQVALPKRMLLRKPDAYEVINQTGPGNVWPKGGVLRVVNGNVTFISSAPPGVEFHVRMLAAGSTREREAPLEPDQDIAEAVADIENAGDGSGEQDEWTG